MYNNVSEQFATTIRSPSRTFNLRLKINGKWINAGFKKMSYETASTSDEGLQIGSAVAAKIELTVKRIDELFENTEIPIEIGLKLPSGKYEYIPLGFFTAEHPTLDQATTTFTAYDRMMKTTGVYVSELTYPASAESVLKEISTGCGVPCNVSGLNGIIIDTAPVGYTYREVIGYIASLAGGFACVDRTGTIVIKWYEDNDYTINESRIMTFEKNESDYHLDYLTCNVDSNTSFTAGSGTLGIIFDNPLMTEEKLNSVYKKVREFAYRGASLKTLGDIRLDPWDIVTVEELGETYKVPIMNITQEYDGGLAMTITAYGKTETETETDYKGPSTKLAERTYAEMMLTKELVAKKVDAEWVKANTVQAETIVSINNDLENIRNNYLKSNVAEITYATIESLKSLSGEFADLKATDFEAIKASVKDLNVDVEKVNTLLFGSATGTTITTDFANSVVSVIGNAQITSAMIKDLAFDKITGIDINTTVMNVHSEDGKSTWKDNTIQISDKDRVRIQLGKDAAGDYNIYIWDKNGNLMFDPLYGVQEDGIKKAIIRNDMVSDNAAISGKKLDIDSVFSVMNADKSNTFNASKIHVDTTDQTLESTFQTINNYVSGGSEAWGSAMLQAKTFIEHKLWWTDIDAEGNSINSKFSDVKQTLDSFKVSMSDVSKRLDGTFEQYEVNEIPTLDNYPATDFFVPVYPADDWYPAETDTWQFTQEEYANHAGAVAYYKDANRTWRFLKQANGEYGWTEVSTSETAYMLNKYATFQVLIDGLTSEVGNVKVDIKDNYSTTESVKSLIKQSADSLSTTISKTYTTTIDFKEAIKDVKSYADTAAGSAQTGAEATASAALTDALKNYTITKDMTSAIEQSAEKVRAYVSETYKRAGGDFNTYEVSEVPTLDNYPATDFFVPVYPADDWYPEPTDTWQFTDESYAEHIGAIAYNPDNKKTWRFIRKDDTWQWEEISSSETSYMLNRFAQHDVNLSGITSELSSTKKNLTDNYSTTTEMLNKIIQEISDDKSSITSSLKATYATQKYADDAANTAATGANGYTDAALKQYSTTAEIAQAINKDSTSISAAVTAKLGDYATTASLTALIKNKDGQLKSAIEAIADTINITARGGLNISGNRITIDSDNFALNANGEITKCQSGVIGGWRIGATSIYSTIDSDDGYTYDVALNKATKATTHILQVTKEKNNLFEYPLFVNAKGVIETNCEMISGWNGNTIDTTATIMGGDIKVRNNTNKVYTQYQSAGIFGVDERDGITKFYCVTAPKNDGDQGLYLYGAAGLEAKFVRDGIDLWYMPNRQKYTRVGKGHIYVNNAGTGYFQDCAMSVIGGIKTTGINVMHSAGNGNYYRYGCVLNRSIANNNQEIYLSWDGTYLRIHIDDTIIASYHYDPGSSEWV